MHQISAAAPSAQQRGSRVARRAERRRRRSVGSSALLGVLVYSVAAASAAADVSGPNIVSFLNAQRAAAGIPAAIVEDPALSDGCAKHNAYGRANGGLAHGEDPSLPGYTMAGDTAARTSVLYAGSVWTAAQNPFETAPVHLHQLLAPRLDRMGASENHGFGCATTLASRNRPAPASDVTYTYPGDRATNWPSAQTAAEVGQNVAIPAGTQTGPYLYVMFDGPDLTPFDTATATGATLAGPDGAVDVVVVDNHTPGVGDALPTGMQVIPRTPLKPATTYTANVTANVTSGVGSGPARTFTKNWSFTTAQHPIAGNCATARTKLASAQTRLRRDKHHHRSTNTLHHDRRTIKSLKGTVSQTCGAN